MVALSRVCGLLGLVGLVVGAQTARADLPPPPGQVRVQYTVKVTGGGPDVALVAHPTYASGGGSVERVTPDGELRLWQGYRPGIYSVPAGEVGALIGKSGPEVDALLAAKAKLCVKRVPRVFQVEEQTRITAMTDVFHVEATATSCRATLVRTDYVGANGERGAGGVDAQGNRLPPAPFTGEGLPRVEELGFSPETPKETPGPATAPTKQDPTAKEPAKTADAPVTTPADARSSAPPPASASACAVADGSGSSLALLMVVGLTRMRRRARRPARDLA